jgi:hypothetical protein
LHNARAVDALAITFVTDTSTAAAGSSYSYQPPADDDYDDSYGEFNRERKAAAVARHQGHEATALLDVIRTTVELLKASKESYEVACARPSRRAMARTIVWREVGCCRRCIRPRRRRWRAGCSRLTERTRCVCST